MSCSDNRNSLDSLERFQRKLPAVSVNVLHFWHKSNYFVSDGLRLPEGLFGDSFVVIVCW